MKPFRTSLTARVVCTAVTLALLGGGLGPMLGIERTVSIILACIVPALITIPALLYGVHEYPAEVILSALLLPVGLWAHTLLVLVAFAVPRYAPLFLVASAVPIGFLVAPMILRAMARSEQGSASSVHEAHAAE